MDKTKQDFGQVMTLFFPKIERPKEQLAKTVITCILPDAFGPHQKDLQENQDYQGNVT